MRTNEEQREYMKEYRKRRKAAGKPITERTPEQVRAHDLWKRYRIRVEEYDAMRLAQNNRCAICDKEFNAANVKGSHPANCNVDHCHSTGAVRGLLCNECNLGLGKFKDDISLLQAAVSYLLP